MDVQTTTLPVSRQAATGRDLPASHPYFWPFWTLAMWLAWIVWRRPDAVRLAAGVDRYEDAWRRDLPIELPWSLSPDLQPEGPRYCSPAEGIVIRLKALADGEIQCLALHNGIGKYEPIDPDAFAGLTESWHEKVGMVFHASGLDAHDAGAVEYHKPRVRRADVLRLWSWPEGDTEAALAPHAEAEQVTAAAKKDLATNTIRRASTRELNRMVEQGLLTQEEARAEVRRRTVRPPSSLPPGMVTEPPTFEEPHYIPWDCVHAADARKMVEQAMQRDGHPGDPIKYLRDLLYAEKAVAWMLADSGRKEPIAGDLWAASKAPEMLKSGIVKMPNPDHIGPDRGYLLIDRASLEAALMPSPAQAASEHFTSNRPESGADADIELAPEAEPATADATPATPPQSLTATSQCERDMSHHESAFKLLREFIIRPDSPLPPGVPRSQEDEAILSRGGTIRMQIGEVDGRMVSRRAYSCGPPAAENEGEMEPVAAGQEAVAGASQDPVAEADHSAKLPPGRRKGDGAISSDEPLVDELQRMHADGMSLNAASLEIARRIGGSEHQVNNLAGRLRNKERARRNPR